MRIKGYRDKGDLPSIMKEFKKITRKPIPKIKELKNKNGDGIVNPKKMLEEIDKHIEKNMKKSAQEEEENELEPDFIEQINKLGPSDNLINMKENDYINKSNDKRLKSKLWYYITRKIRTTKHS